MSHINGKNLDDATIFTFKTQEMSMRDRNDAGREKNQSKIGGFRHIVAILALSSIVLANSNRQAYNQSLVRMVKANVVKKADVDSSETSLSTAGISSDSIQSSTASSLEYTSLGEISKPYSLTGHTLSPESLGQEISSTRTTPSNSDDAADDGYDWTSAQISLLQSAFSYGYTPFMIPGGRMSEVYGAKWVVFLSGFGSAVCSLAVPFLADYNFILLVMSRILMGESSRGRYPTLRIRK